MNGPAVHATVVALPRIGGWAGVMLRGSSGSGKSDLALRLIAEGGRLVADDYAVLWASGGRLYATAPETIAGRIEARTLGIVSQPTRWIAPVGLITDLTQEVIERLPEPRSETLRGVSIPALKLDPRPASATTLIALALTTGSLSQRERA